MADQQAPKPAQPTKPEAAPKPTDQKTAAPRAKPAPADLHGEPQAHVGRHFVVLHDSIGGVHEKGKVAAAEQLGNDANIDRLIAAKAVRPATDDEAKLGQVTILDGTARAQTAETEIAKLQAERDALKARVTELENQAGVKTAQGADETGRRLAAEADKNRQQQAAK